VQTRAPHNVQPGTTAFGAPSGPILTLRRREAQRLDRERAERANHERREGDDAVPQLNDGQREEINRIISLFNLNKTSYLDNYKLKVAMEARVSTFSNTNSIKVVAFPSLSAPLTNTGVTPSPGDHIFAGLHRVVPFGVHAARGRAAFDLFHENKKGIKEPQKLRGVALEFGEGLSEEEILR
ncbi:hypothetical protein GCG54_00015408, partial [Colletotrichum gloeosporioides]